MLVLVVVLVLEIVVQVNRLPFTRFHELRSANLGTITPLEDEDDDEYEDDTVL